MYSTDRPFNITKRFLTVIVALIALLVLGAGPCPAAEKAEKTEKVQEKAQKKDPKEILARWGKKTITRGELEARVATLPPEFQMRIQSEEQLKDFLEGLIQIDMIGAEARARKLDKRKDLASKINDTVNSILAQEYMQAIVLAAKKPTEKEIDAYYEAHKGEYVHPAQVKAQHILVKLDPDPKPEAVAEARKKAEGIRKELLAGGDFAKLAEQHSEDPGSKANGGDLGFFTKDRMIPEFSKVAFGLKKDEISEPVQTAYGFHIIKVNENVAEKPMEKDEAVSMIQPTLENAKRQAAAEKELERLKKKYNVRISEASGAKK